MKKIEKINGKYMINCIILTEGEIPSFAGIRGPLLIPRPMEVDVVKTLLFFNVDVRAVDGMDYKIGDAQKLTIEKVEELINGKKPEPQQLKPEPKVEQPPVEKVKEEVIKETVAEKVKPEPKPEPKVEQPPVEEVKEEVKPAQNNKKGKK